jgi:hypothetical protein
MLSVRSQTTNSEYQVSSTIITAIKRQPIHSHPRICYEKLHVSIGLHPVNATYLGRH